MRRFARGALLTVLLAAVLTLRVVPAEIGFETLWVDAGGRTPPVQAWETGLALRYADDGMVIPLAVYRFEHLIAPIPQAYRGRPVELCETAPVHFSDDSEYEYENGRSSYIRQLARLGVMGGNDRGEAEPERPLTRAEAAAILVRLLGVPPASGTPYADVPADAWYAGEVYTAQVLGVVGPGERFEPDRPVTRQEFMVMTARTFALVGFIELPERGDRAALREAAEDADRVAPEAVSAYERLIKFALKTGRKDGAGRTAYYFEPEAPVAREDAAALVANCRWHLPVYPAPEAVEFGLSEGLPVIDGSTSTQPLADQLLESLYSGTFYHPELQIRHTKTHTAYERLIAGEVDLVLAGVAPGREISALAASRGVELELVPVGCDAMVFFTNAENGVSGLTVEQLSELYVHNSPKSWAGLGGEEATLYPYCRNEDSGSHANMERYILGGQPIHPDIQDGRTAGSMATIFSSVASAPELDPPGYGIGYSLYYYYQKNYIALGGVDELGNPRLKLLAIDGVQPTDETIASGAYPLSDYIYAVVRADTPENAPARGVVNYLRSEAGQQCVRRAGFGTLW